MPCTRSVIRLLTVLGLELALLTGAAWAWAVTPPDTPGPDIQSQINALVSNLSSSKTVDEDRWQIIQLCLLLSKSPATPSAAQSEYAQGDYLFHSAHPNSGAAEYENAAAAFARASLIAPCVADYYHDRALALQQALKYGGRTQDAKDAAMSLHWYLTAAPNTPQAQNIISNIGVLEDQAGVNSDTHLGWVPLVWAMDNADTEAVRSLLASGADVNATYDYSYISKKNVTALQLASLSGNFEIVKMLVTRGARIDAADSQGATALFLAAMKNHLSVVQYLVTHGADVNHITTDSSDNTILAIAAWNGNLAVVKFLVSAGARVNLPNGSRGHGWTPLVMALLQKHLDVAQFLISAGAKINQANADGTTPLMKVAKYDNLSAVQLLISHGAQVNAIDGMDYTALTWAVAEGNMDVIRYLIAHGADINWVSNWAGLSITGFAALGGPLDEVKYLVASGADINTPRGGRTPLIAATQDRCLKIVKFLLSQHARVDAADSEGHTALFLASTYGYMDIARELVKHGADVNWSSNDQSQDNVLGIAAYNGRLNMVKFLVAHGANVNSQMKDGSTPFDLANESNNSANAKDKIAVANFLRSKGGMSGQALKSAALGSGSLAFLLLILIFGAIKGLRNRRLPRV